MNSVCNWKSKQHSSCSGHGFLIVLLHGVWHHCGDTYRMTDYSVKYQATGLLGTNWGPWITGGGGSVPRSSAAQISSGCAILVVACFSHGQGKCSIFDYVSSSHLTSCMIFQSTTYTCPITKPFLSYSILPLDVLANFYLSDSAKFSSLKSDNLLQLWFLDIISIVDFKNPSVKLKTGTRALHSQQHPSWAC